MDETKQKEPVVRISGLFLYYPANSVLSLVTGCFRRKDIIIT